MAQAKKSNLHIKHSVSVSAAFAGIALSSLLIGIPLMMNEVANMERELHIHRKEYIDLTNHMWSDLMIEKANVRHIRAMGHVIDKRQYDFETPRPYTPPKQNPRSCSQGSKGQPGIPGEPGMDGMDGTPGRSGMTGNDVQNMMFAVFSEDDNPYGPGPVNPCAPCPSGPAGLPGYKGKRGMRGGKGEKGPSGISGRPGELGEEGPEGELGLQGDLGPPGARGHPGEDGTAYTKGPKGEKGPIGMAGMEGDEGPPGERGDDAPMGPVGAPGLQGPQGQPGKPGILGANGQAGKPGADAEYCPCPDRSKEPGAGPGTNENGGGGSGGHPFETNSIFPSGYGAPEPAPAPSRPPKVPNGENDAEDAYGAPQPSSADSNIYHVAAPSHDFVPPPSIPSINSYKVAIPAPKSTYYPNSTPLKDAYNGGIAPPSLPNDLPKLAYDLALPGPQKQAHELLPRPPAVSPGVGYGASHEFHQESGYRNAENGRTSYTGYGAYPPAMKRAFKFRRNRA